MILADTLSRLPNPINNDDVDLGVRVDGLALEADDPQHLTIALINIPTAKQQLMKDEALRDPVLNAMKESVYSGWPHNVKELPSDLRAYWSFRGELAVEAGVVFLRANRAKVAKSNKTRTDAKHCYHTACPPDRGGNTSQQLCSKSTTAITC